ncbi:hypothetical protein BPOR_0510g00040 [Botrytis porri]|uniref:Uncharacterized protein n=1 Tax=Botrytis porri TaxID=87229 RepID=A0A4Z1KFU7_9HELO|nr:hypothetical protein BPOR_0510g00040 [Botrytis porri]
MVHRINPDPNDIDTASDDDVASMLNEFWWAVMQRSTMFCENAGPDFQTFAALVIPEAESSMMGMSSGATYHFKIATSPNLNQFQQRRADDALKDLRTTFWVKIGDVQEGDQTVYQYTLYDSSEESDNDLLALGFMGEAVLEIRRAFQRGELYCKVTDDQGNILQGMIPPRPGPAVRRQFFTGRNVLQELRDNEVALRGR